MEHFTARVVVHYSNGASRVRTKYATEKLSEFADYISHAVSFFKSDITLWYVTLDSQITGYTIETNIGREIAIMRRRDGSIDVSELTIDNKILN